MGAGPTPYRAARSTRVPAGRLAALLLAASLTACAARDATGGAGVPPAAGPPMSDGSTASPPATEPATSTPPPETSPATRTAAPADRPLEGRVVVLDPGHNGRNVEHPEEIGRLVDIGTGTKACNTTGTATDDGYAEATFTWELAGRARAVLERLGAAVVLTRADNDGWGPCIDERAAIANRAAADAVVSIHADGGPAHGRGFHVIHPAPVPGLTDDIAVDSRRLALALRSAMLRTGVPTADYIGTDGLSERSDLGGLNLSDVPAVFLEAGNMRNAADAALLADPAHRDALADALAAAVVSFLAPGGG